MNVFAILAAAPVLLPLLRVLPNMVEWVVRSVFGAVFQHVMLHDDEARRVLLAYLRRKRARSVGYSAVQCQNQYVRPLSRWTRVFFVANDVGQALMFFRGVPVLLRGPWGAPQSIVWLRGTVDFKKLFLEAAEHDWPSEEDRKRRFEENHPTQYVYHAGLGHRFMEAEQRPTMRYESNVATPTNAPPTAKVAGGHVDDSWSPVGWERADLGMPESPDMLGDLSTSPALEAFVEDLKFWSRNREWYEERGIPWNRRYLLAGKPGTGKSTLVRAVAQMLRFDVHRFDLATFDNAGLHDQWTQTRGSERINLIEDVDRVFDKQENLSGGPLTLDAVLNAVDGVEQDNGMLLFLTANDATKIDASLYEATPDGRPSRYGRVDVCVCMPDTLDEAGRRKIAARVLDGYADVAGEAVAAGAQDTPAQFTGRCISAAVKCLWGKR